MPRKQRKPQPDFSECAGAGLPHEESIAVAGYALLKARRTYRHAGIALPNDMLKDLDDLLDLMGDTENWAQVTALIKAEDIRHRRETLELLASLLAIPKATLGVTTDEVYQQVALMTGQTTGQVKVNWMRHNKGTKH